MIECPCCGGSLNIGQAELTEEEKSRVDWAGPPQNGRPNIIEAQVIKAIAQYYGVEDWMSYWDKTLSPSENAEIFRKKGSEGRPSMNEVGFEETIRTGAYEQYQRNMEW